MFNTTKLTQSIHSTPALSPSETELREAAGRLAGRTDDFGISMHNAAIDLASKLAVYGRYASPKQQAFAARIVNEYSKPRPASTDWGRPVPKLFDVMQRHAHLYVDPLKLSRKNQDTLVWVLYGNACVGKIENGRAQVWAHKAEAAGTTALAVLALIEEFEADPLAAAQKYGKLAGRCCSCGRDLTDPVSIEAGIGPVCAQRFA